VDAGLIPGRVFHNHIPYRGPDEIERLVSIKHSKVPPGRLICPQVGAEMWLEPDNSRVPTAVFCFRMAYSRTPSNKSELKPFDPACAYFQSSCRIRIKRVIVELTDQPVDRPLSHILPWMKDYDDKRIFEERNFTPPGPSHLIFVIRR
jgi:hypothetical protein